MKMEVKTKAYDKFRCTAQACTLTCCKGWDIRADGGIYEKWKANDKTAYLCQHVTYRKEEQEGSYHMKTSSGKACEMLDENGLCEIVKRHGEQYLSETCAQFPRKCNTLEIEENTLLKEYALSGACPAALDILWNECNNETDTEVCFYDSEKSMLLPMEYRVRNALTDILKNKKYALTDRLLLGFSFLHECLECEWENEVDDCIEVYSENENLWELLNVINKTTCAEQEAFQELCQTFYDVTQFYKLEDMYRPYLENLSEYVEALYPQNIEVCHKEMISRICSDWEQFKKDFKKYDDFMEAVIVSEVFSDCVSDDFVYIIEAYQAIVLEYAMTRLSVFLKNEQENVYLYETVRDYLSLYVRMIGHNTAGMTEYWEENFEDSVLEKDYLYLLIR